MAIIDHGLAGPDDPIYNTGLTVHSFPRLPPSTATSPAATAGGPSAPAPEATRGMDDPVVMQSIQDSMNARMKEMWERKTPEQKAAVRLASIKRQDPDQTPDRSNLTLSPVPLRLQLDDIVSKELTVLFAMGIVNPFGPTLTLAALLGEAKSGNVLPVVTLMLNPFSQEARRVGYMRIGDVWHPEQDLAPLCSLKWGACPTLLLLNASLEEAAGTEITERLLSQFQDDVSDVASSVQRDFGDPWTRISNEIASHAEVESNPEKGVRLLSDLILRPEHVWPEIRALLYAWNGSIESTGIPESLKNKALSANWFQNFLCNKVLPSVWLPDPPKG